MNILIIGAKGFIGSNALTHLSNSGHVVWGCDVVVDYSSPRYYLIDPTNSDFHSIFETEQLDVCINCSGAASVPDSIKNPLRDYYLNTVNVFKILDAIRKIQPACKFINLSSAAVYGNPKRLPILEEDKLNLVSPYGIHKLHAEQICKEFSDFYGIQTCSLRIFSAYGDGLKKQLFWDLYNKAKAGIPFTLYGTGKESRDFIYIGDLVRAIELVSLSSNFEAEIYNVANGNEIFIKDAVSVFFSLFENDINYSFSGEERKGDPINWVADISKLKALGYNSSFDLKTGLQQYFKWITQSDAG
jgi:dTDP-glucose 4,6-dehydratase/UDP-glucose 4-epimerase